MDVIGIEDLVTLVEDVASSSPGRTVWIGIDGFGGSGKTSLARLLASVIAGAQWVSVDDFAGPGVPTWDFERFVAQVVQPLNDGRPARYERRGWGADQGGWVTVRTGGLLIVEGVSSTDSRADVDWDLTVWVHTEPAERRRRIRLRDDAATLARWESDWWPSERAYAADQDPAGRADVVVAGQSRPRS